MDEADRPNPAVVRALAGALEGGVRAVDTLLGRRWRWVPGLVDRYAVRFGAGTRPRRREVVRWLLEDERFRRAWRREGARLRVVRWIGDEPARMLPAPAAGAWGVPELATLAELAAWLHVSDGELEWFADVRGLETQAGCRLQHYRYRSVRKRSGGLRLIEEPKARLKTMQRRVLGGVLDRVPVHGAAHGFVRGRSIRSFAAPHVGRELVLRMDLAEFFPGVKAARVGGFFRLCGYPEPVAERLAGLCLNAAPAAVLEGFGDARGRYAQRHLPQGAPTSPALANVLCYGMDVRLSGLARAAGGVYTRYADDLAFSGDGTFARGVARFAAHAAAVVAEEGFAINHRKTRVMRQGVRQQLAGLVVNAKVGVGRAEFDALKATLVNCARRGVAGENREGRADFRAYLEGRVAFMESVDGARGAKLRAWLGRIDWGGQVPAG